MGWASKYIERLEEGKAVTFRPHGRSMEPRIKSGDLCTVVPFATDCHPIVGDIVLCRVRGREYLHFVQGEKDGKYLIGNNKGHSNGWVSREQVFGLLVAPTAPPQEAV